MLEGVVRRSEPVALSAISLLEIAILKSEGKLRLQVTLDEFLDEMQANEVFQILPLSYQVASDVAALGSLRDPADRAIVATARVHKLHVMTSDQRIIESKLVPVIA